ncbi:MAG: M1 family metallopeptidase [Rudaea sp.]|nr:M1 family metallopeptidase [Rudaea sp.]
MRAISALFAAAAAALSLSVHAAEAVPTGKLPDGVAPVSYALELKIDPNAERFSGNARIKVELTKAADHLWLHGNNLAVSKVEVIDAQGKSHAAKYLQRDADGVAEIAFGASLPAQTLELRLSYSAAFNKTADGLFKAKIGKDVYAVTQLEALSGRKVFPGFDEPRFKTPFEVSLIVPKAQTAFANTLPARESDSADGKWKTITYAATQPLPTYLIAFAVGPWDVAEAPALGANDVRKTPVALRAIGPRGSAPQLKWALEQVPALVEYYEKYTNQAYPFGKLDLLGSANFAGAMENAGLLIFDEALLRFDEHSPANEYRGAYDTIAHEIAHQWFGDLVTVPWWDDLWLNESFATWWASKVTVALRPGYLADLSRAEDTRKAMRKDSLLSARRVRQPIANPGDVGTAFDDITYLKGAAVLLMFEQWLGEDAFRDALRQYLAAHAFGNGNSEDLIETIARVTGKGEPMKAAMRSFLDQPGIPLVRAELKCDAGKGALVLSQSRYLPYGAAAKETQQWSVPVCARLGRGAQSAQQCFLLDQPQREFALDGGCADWVLPNANAAGYYRFSLSESALATLREHIGSLSAPEQLVYADAVSSAFRRGELPPTAVLDAMPALATSDKPQVATALVSDFNWIDEHLADTQTRSALQAWASRLYAPSVAALGYQRKAGEADATTDLRSRVIDFLALDVEDKAVREELNKQGRAVLGLDGGGKVDLSRVDADLRGIALTVAVQDSGAAAFAAVLKELAGNHDPQQRADLLHALGSTRDAALGEKARNYGLTPAVSDIEMGSIYSAQNSEPEIRPALWAWYKAHYDAFNGRFYDEAKSAVISLPAVGRCSKSEADELSHFFATRVKNLMGGERALTQALEGIGQCAALREHAGTNALAEWAKTHGH